MTDLWHNFAILFCWGLQFLWTWWFLCISIVLFLNLAIASAWTMSRRSVYWEHRYWVVFLPLLAYPAIAFAGAIAWNTGVPVPPLDRPAPNAIAEWCVLILNIVSVGFGIILIFKMRHLRWFSVSVFLFIQWVLTGINFMVAMPIGGVWL